MAGCQSPDSVVGLQQKLPGVAADATGFRPDQVSRPWWPVGYFILCLSFIDSVLSASDRMVGVFVGRCLCLCGIESTN